jgi:hypothetical protein
MNSASAVVTSRLVDEMMELYCDWRTECAEVHAAYRRFSDAEGADRLLAFAAYVAALDREGSASDAYAAQLRLITARVTDGQRRTDF